ARHWKNWWRLLTPPGALAPTRWALAILDRGTLCRLIIRGEGSHELGQLPGLGPPALAEYKRTLGVSAVIAIERRLVAELSADIEAALRLHQDLVPHGLTALRAL